LQQPIGVVKVQMVETQKLLELPAKLGHFNSLKT